MSRRRSKKAQAPPLDPNVVSDFHVFVLNGDTKEVNKQLISTPRLANAKDGLGFTPLMKVVRMSEASSWQTQVQLIDSLMQRGASLATRDPYRCHVLLLACKRGAAPQVIDCLLRWNSKRGEDLKWYHCNSNKDGALVLAARSGSIELVSHLLSLDEMVDPSSYCDSNAPIKVVDAAITAGNEQLVLLVLRHGKLKDEIYDLDIHESDDEDDEDAYYGYGEESGSVRSIFVDDCVREAYKTKMFEAVYEMLSVSKDVPVTIWLCWRESMREAQQRSKNSKNEVASSEATTPARIEAIARACQENLVHRYNPALLPLLMARSRHTLAITSSSHNNAPYPLIVTVEDDIFRHIAKYCFTLGPDALQKKIEQDRYFQKNAQYCTDCEGLFLPYTCMCCVYNGYSS
jgi:hypothetical protein